MIVGEEGVIMDDAQGQFWLYQKGQATPLEIDQPDTTIATAFVSTILDGAENLSPAYQGANVVDFLEAIYRSAEESRIVQLDPGPQDEADVMSASQGVS
jgi:predicted dehydrogenase